MVNIFSLLSCLIISLSSAVLPRGDADGDCECSRCDIPAIAIVRARARCLVEICTTTYRFRYILVFRFYCGYVDYTSVVFIFVQGSLFQR